MARTKDAALSLEKKLAQALVPVEEQPYEVPENWCWCRMDRLYTINPKVSAPDEIEAAFVPMERIEAGLSSAFTFEIQSWSKARKGHTQFADGDIAFAKISPCFENRKSIIIEGLPNGIGGGTTELIVLRNRMVDRQYTYYQICADRFIQGGRQTYSGTVGQQRISMDYVRSYPIPLPPLHEQHRIVDQIERLFAELDEAKERAQAVIDSYEDRKASILHRAFTGELTEEWREKNNLTLSDWRSTPWGDFILSIEAGKNWSADGRPPLDGEFGVVKVSAVTWGEFNENESKTCLLSEQWNDKVQIHTGDFLFSRANTLQLVGNCVIVSNISKRLMLSDKILRLSFSVEVVPRYVLHFTRSDFYRKQIEELATGNQDGMRNIAQNQMRKVSFPIPTLAEQHEIVRILDSLLMKESAAKAAAEQAIDQIDTMKKSILARAFRGELGTNDPNDEPAIELLKRSLEARA